MGSWNGIQLALQASECMAGSLFWLKGRRDAASLRHRRCKSDVGSRSY